MSDDFLEGIKYATDPKADVEAAKEDLLFLECFGTPSGQDVLEILKVQFYDLNCDVAPPAYGQFLGRRDVVYYILERIKGAKNE